MGWTKQARQRVNPLGVRKGQVYQKTDKRPNAYHYGDYYLVERVSFVRGKALVSKCWMYDGTLHRWSLIKKTWVKLDRFSPTHHLRRLPDYTYRIAA